MEIALIAFVAGLVVAMTIAALADRVRDLLAILLIPVAVVGIWFCWATIGAPYFLKRVEAVHQESVRKVQNVKPEEKLRDADQNLTALGQTGDLFGGINALFAALAFAGVAIAALMQGRSLRLSVEQQRQQSFEPLFFHLLELHASVAAPKFKMGSAMSKLGASVTTASGSPARVDFARAMTVLRRALRMSSVGYTAAADRSEKLAADCRKVYETFYSQNENELGPHFRSLYQIFKLIDDAQFEKLKKIRYANIARSTLSRDQLFLLAVNCLSVRGAEFKPYVERYGLLKHIARDPVKPTMDERVAKWCYRESATLGAQARTQFRD